MCLLKQTVEHGLQGSLIKSEHLAMADDLLEFFFKVMCLGCQLTHGQLVSDEGTAAMSALKVSFCGEFFVDSENGVGIDSQRHRQLSDGWDFFARFKGTSQTLRSDLADNLPTDGHT